MSIAEAIPMVALPHATGDILLDDTPTPDQRAS
jgi:hypothetical protein